MNTNIWSEKYRPTKLSDFIGNSKLINDIKKWFKNFINKEKGTKKCLLLVGPPGVGKTTIAKIILNYYNYDIVEFNASDVRNQKLVRDKLNQILNKKCVLNMMKEQPKKIAIIMDEIDGMSSGDKGGVSELMTILGMGKKQINITTPIICICNKVVEKKLKELKSKSEVITIPKPNKMLLQMVINNIIEKENISNLDPFAINYIISHSQCDFRRLINIMEYLFSNTNLRLKENIEIEDIEIYLSNMGEKNIDITIYEAANKILNTSIDLKKNGELFITDSSGLSLILYENFPNTIIHNRKDSNKNKIIEMSKIYKSFSDGDIYDYNTYIYQHWDLMEYNSINKSAFTNFILKNMPKYSHQKNTNITFSTLLNKSSLEYLNYKGIDYLNIKLNSYNNQNIYKNIYDSILNYILSDDKQNIEYGIKLLKHYNLTIDDIDKMIKHGYIFDKKHFPNSNKKELLKLI